MEWTLEVVPIPVADVDRAKRLYSEQVGFVVDLDTQSSDDIIKIAHGYAQQTTAVVA